ncbi:Mu transposase domain-containing protein [Onishia taeanensis]|uniref:Mu transposase domain-containing protein n=1 Tax=Onishia TaxID=3137765 RepID=UPI003CC921BE
MELGSCFQRDATVEVATNLYCVPCRLIGEPVLVSVTDGDMRVQHVGQELARHSELSWRPVVRFLPYHLQCIVSYRPPKVATTGALEPSGKVATLDLSSSTGCCTTVTSSLFAAAVTDCGTSVRLGSSSSMASTIPSRSPEDKGQISLSEVTRF